ncbi:hypothetical protein BO86DRAFT_399502 [Aspergillus japonicus CBS 114.51]|uniref:Uncharacterized protein n=1 Tax=Aspergillus japonicus CBS 114.51 TaxID=1448312 RepID=A0A8T8X2W7_ASPJA|nr:hypothetical protein BO86DRAFT_399502 [Aspergillus japonicus CBS 114.51]RAH81972.1 hypothetical protein BO86DRAFT_399502 [Aspergillus japonicus CBS 114.51]
MPNLGNSALSTLWKQSPDKLVANVVLQGGTPNTNFNVRLIQLKNWKAVKCGPCTSGGATLTTDSDGNGNMNVQRAVSPGANAAWVDLNNQNKCEDFFDIGPLTFG